jgi:hypothetical protein
MSEKGAFERKEVSFGADNTNAILGSCIFQLNSYKKIMKLCMSKGQKTTLTP